MPVINDILNHQTLSTLGGLFSRSRYTMVLQDINYSCQTFVIHHQPPILKAADSATSPTAKISCSSTSSHNYSIQTAKLVDIILSLKKRKISRYALTFVSLQLKDSCLRHFDIIGFIKRFRFCNFSVFVKRSFFCHFSIFINAIIVLDTKTAKGLYQDI